MCRLGAGHTGTWRLGACYAYPRCLASHQLGLRPVDVWGCRNLLPQLRRDGDGDGCGPFAIDAVDADEADEFADDVGTEAGTRQTRTEAGGFAHRTDEAEPGEVVAFEERVTEGVVEGVAMRHHDEISADRRFGHRRQAVGVVQDACSAADGVGK